MAILSKEDYMSRLKGIVGDATTDEAMALIEDFSDTYADLETRASADTGAEWKQKYEENDKSWREKYKARFFETGTTADEVKAEQTEDVKDDAETKDFGDLFEEREG